MTQQKQIQDPMIRIFRWLILSLAAGTITVSCVYDFTPNLPAGKEGIIVIEGDILAGDYSEFKISTTISLSAPDEEKYITNATVWVESESGEVIHAVYDGNTKGSFMANTSQLNVNQKHKLCVDIPGRGSYRSAMIPVLESSQIDSISYSIAENKESVRIEVTTHNNHPDMKYYKWLYREDWEFRSEYMLMLRYNDATGNIETIPYDEMGKFYYCWERDSSTGIFIASTDKLSQNIVYKQPLKTIYRTDRRISYLYAIQVSQIALSKEGYDYWETLKKNTDETGGIFAPQPSEMRGNLESITKPEEPVIGFISASTLTQQRRFISDKELRVYRNPFKCQQDTLSRIDWKAAAEGGRDVILELPEQGKAIWVPVRCTNCVEAGGSKNKPSFWPNNDQ